MRQAIFHNFTEKPFTGYWNGKAYTFQPGAKKQMQASIAQHFAKHLTNKILMEKGGEFENYTSPKKPEQVPAFMELFEKACIMLDDQVDEIGLTPDPVTGRYERGPSMNIDVQPRRATDPYDASAQPQVGPGGKSTVITGPDGGIADDEESQFADTEEGGSDEGESGEGE